MNCFCFPKKNIFDIFTNKQRKYEYKKIKANMSYIGNNQPKSVYKGYSNDIAILYFIKIFKN